MTLAARLAAAFLVAAALLPPAFARQPDGGEHMPSREAADVVSADLDRRLVDEVNRNRELLRRQGLLPAQTDAPPKISGLQWPMGPNPGIGVDYHGISNYVDLNAAFPNQVRDYTCGTRTYDSASGYNHRGVDYFTWPFPWQLLDEGAIEVRAAAAGTLIARQDGRNDRSCSFDAPDTPNYVVIQHADGTIARYLHLKNGSVLTAPIGRAIAAGQLLGRVGSSGVSTGPHLHFELRASNDVNAANIESHNGACNLIPSAWPSQRPYRDSRINRISTHGAPPVAPTCSGTTMPGTDQPNFKNQFNPGEHVLFLSAYRDQGRGQVAQYRVLRPDLSVFASWSFDMAEVSGTPAFYNASYWYWDYTLPANAPHGLWQYEATFQGVTTRHHFRVGNSTTAIADMKGLIGAWYDPDTSGQGFELHWINGDIALLFFYGHHDNGQNFFLLGQRNGMWDFNQEVEFSMYQTTGGRWTDFDPDLIQRPAWGTARLTFIGCETAVAELDGIDGTQVLTLERLGRTIGLDCD